MSAGGTEYPKFGPASTFTLAFHNFTFLERKPSQTFYAPKKLAFKT